ncbi:MAG: hypothetical protein ACE5I7_19210 [Candidatus Binatia bacterium]
MPCGLRSRTRLHLLLCIIGAFVPLADGTARAQCTPIAATRLVIRSSEDDSKDRIKWVSQDPAVSFLINDPTHNDTTIELRDQDGVVLTAATSAASAAAWKSSGNPVRLWRYNGSQDPTNTDGIIRITSKANRVFFKGRGVDLSEIRAPLAYPLTGYRDDHRPQLRVDRRQ